MKKTDAAVSLAAGGALEERKEAGVLMVMDFESDAGAGFEEADQSSYAIPFIKLLQSMSKQCKKLDGNYIKGAEEGMYYNSVTSELYDGTVGLFFIPCHFRRKFIEYTGTQDEKGVYVREYTAEEGEKILPTCIPDAKNNLRIPNTQGAAGNGNILTDVREHYVILLHPDTGMPMKTLISLASSQIKVSKQFMSRSAQLKRNPIQKNPDACFSHVYRLTSIPQVKDSFSYFGNKIEHVSGLEASGEQVPFLLSPEAQMYVYREAKDFNELVRSGKVELDKSGYQSADDASGVPECDTVGGDEKF